MNKNQFKAFCKMKFELYGFKKVKKCFYLIKQDILCGLELQKSNYGNIYYINLFYCVGNYNNITTDLPTSSEGEISSRICVMSKTQTHQGKYFMTAQIEYEEYSEDELELFFDKELKEKVLPPIYQGKKYIVENLNKQYFLTLNQNEILCKLQS